MRAKGPTTIFKSTWRRWLALGVASSFGLLIYRQEASPAARAIRNARRLLGE